MLCFLHGYDEAAHREIRQALTRHGPLREPGIPPLTVISSSLPPSCRWPATSGIAMPIPSGISSPRCGRPRGDPLRTYLTGFSFGGNGVFDLPLVQPGVLGGAVGGRTRPGCPARTRSAPCGSSIGEIARSQAEAFIRALALKPADDTVAGAPSAIWTRHRTMSGRQPWPIATSGSTMAAGEAPRISSMTYRPAYLY